MSAAEEAPAPTDSELTFGPPEAEAGGILTIDLGAIEANWRALRSRTTPAECGAVVKGDAYGCGIEPVTALLHHAGCHTFFVADLSEAKRVRRIAPASVIYVLNGLMPGTAPVFAEHHIRPVIGSSGELAEWDAFVAGNNWRGGMAIHVDTGMNRLGVRVEEAAAIAARLQTENHGISLLMSHFVSSEIPDDPLNNKQILLFRDIRRMFRGVPSSLANSSGIFLGASAYCDLVRPGVALYGANPTPGRTNPMQPVIDLKGRIIQVRHVPAGETVGYDAEWIAGRPSRIAIVAVGYADGYSRRAGASTGQRGGEALIAGQLCPFVGRISMDMLAIDVTDLPDGAAPRGGLVSLIGDGLDIDTVAKNLGTISYEVMTQFGHRYARVYRGASGAE
jgi:alanine racemase